MDRKVVPQDWKKRLDVIQRKAEEESKELPPGFLGQFTASSQEASVNYFTCVQILDKMKETAERGMLGSLKGDAGKWEKIVKAYEASMLHVAEGGLVLSRNVDFEIPYLKKQTAKNQQQIEDLERKSTELIKSAAFSHQQFIDECEKAGVSTSVVHEGESLDAALLLSAESLPSKLESVCNYLTSNGFEKIIGYYESFVKGHYPDSSDAFLPILSSVVESAEISEYDENSLKASWVDVKDRNKRNEMVNIVDAPEVDAGGDSSAPIEISWDGLEMDTAMTSAEETQQDQAIDISWDIDVSGVGEANDDSTNQLNTDMTNEDATCVTRQDATASLIAALGSCSPHARRLTLDSGYRSGLLDDILELKAFISQRLKETRVTESSFSTINEDSTMDVQSLEKAHATLEHAVAMMTDDDVSHLISMATNASYRYRMAKRIIQLSQKEAKQIQASKDADMKKGDIQRSLVSDSAKQSALVRETKYIKKAIEEFLGAKVKRRINIQGAIHNVIKSG